jgi:prepilin-type N-terminal cleavage/methylation domain-containing protein
MNYRGLMQTSSNKGFTLAELLVGMVISTITLGLAFAAFESASKSYSNDKVRVDTGQSLTAVLDLIGTDIKQAGEQIGNSSFPTVKIVSGNQITLRKALTDALPLCQPVLTTNALLTTATTTANILISDGSIPTATAAGCSAAVPSASPPASALPPSVPDWQTERNGGTGRVALVKTNGQTHVLDYTTEVQDGGYTTNKKYSLTLRNNNTAAESTATVANYATGDSVYLIEERTYRYDAANRELKLRVNGGSEQTLISGLESFSISANVTQTNNTVASEITDLPTTTNANWKKIVGVNVSIEVQKPSSCTASTIQGCADEDFKTSGTFYPRNVMSK